MNDSELQTGLPIDPVQWREFEKLIAQLHVAPGGHVAHDVKLLGRSGSEYQIDCTVEYSVGLYVFLVLISCKDWKRRVDRPAVTELYAVIEDCRASRGVIASASGFTEGAAAYARDKGIDLLHLRGLTDKDWEGRIRAVQITMRLATCLQEFSKRREWRSLFQFCCLWRQISAHCPAIYPQMGGPAGEFPPSTYPHPHSWQAWFGEMR